MLKFHMVLYEPKLDRSRLNKVVTNKANRLMQETARVFLQEVIKHVPIWTGEALGSLAPIAFALHVKLPPLIPHPNAPKNAFGLGASQTHYFDELIKQDGWKFSFIAGTRVDHYKINEAHNVQDEYGIMLTYPTPWHSFDFGRTVAKAYLKQHIGEVMPDYTKFLTWTRVTNV